jgi:hypothetical protein
VGSIVSTRVLTGIKRHHPWYPVGIGVAIASQLRCPWRAASRRPGRIVRAWKREERPLMIADRLLRPQLLAEFDSLRQRALLGPVR